MARPPEDFSPGGRASHFVCTTNTRVSPRLAEDRRRGRPAMNPWLGADGPSRTATGAAAATLQSGGRPTQATASRPRSEPSTSQDQDPSYHKTLDELHTNVITIEPWRFEPVAPLRFPLTNPANDVQPHHPLNHFAYNGPRNKSREPFGDGTTPPGRTLGADAGNMPGANPRYPPEPLLARRSLRGVHVLTLAPGTHPRWDPPTMGPTGPTPIWDPRTDDTTEKSTHRE
jgi:hypothetical protein